MDGCIYVCGCMYVGEGVGVSVCLCSCACILSRFYVVVSSSRISE